MIWKHDVSVGVADLQSFAQLDRQMGTEDAVKLLNAAFQAAGDQVLSCGGSIHKYLGDAMLFTLPDPARADELALKVRKSFFKKVGPTDVQFRIGIATGGVLVTRIGHSSMVEQDVFGETVNRAFLLLNDANENDDGYALCPHTRKFVEGRES